MIQTKIIEREIPGTKFYETDEASHVQLWLEMHVGEPYELMLCVPFTGIYHNHRPAKHYLLSAEEIVAAVKEATGFGLKVYPPECYGDEDGWEWRVDFEIEVDPRIPAEVAEEHAEYVEELLDEGAEAVDIELYAPSLLAWVKDREHGSDFENFAAIFREREYEGRCESAEAMARSRYEMDYYAGYE